jgi:hypothetical protein
MKCSKYKFFFALYIIIPLPEIHVLKLYEEHPIEDFDDIVYKEKLYHGKSYNNNYDNKNNYLNDDIDDFQKPASTFEFIINYIKNQIKSYFYPLEEYISGLKFIISKYKYLFRRFSSKKIINQTLYHTERKNYKSEKTQRKLEQNFFGRRINNKEGKILKAIYPYNNTDLYDKIDCPTIPDLKVSYYNYFCDNKKVSKEEYINRISKGDFCEFYNNTQKICFCPIHYSECDLKTSSKLKCMVKKLIVNNDIDLTKYYDTFYDEHIKTPILNNPKKIYDFSLTLKCGMNMDDDISGSSINFYLLTSNDNLGDFDIISTEYHNTTKNGTQYTKEQVMNMSYPVLNYFIKKRNMILYKETKLSLSFSIIDQQWAIPYRKKIIEINKDSLEDILSGRKSFDFTVDLNDLIENGEGEGPFRKDETFKYPFFDKGDLYFFEIDIQDLSNQIKFMAFRGEIKK